MKRGLYFLWILVIAGFSYADISSRLNITEEDGSPSTYPYQAKFSNGSVTDNGDGTVSINVGGSSGGFTPGSAIFANSSGNLSQDNANLFWDKNNLMLGIGTNMPNHSLHIRSSPSTTPLRVSYDDSTYMDVTQGGSVFHMDVEGSSSFNLTNGSNGNQIQIKANGDNVLYEDGSTGYNRMLVNSGGVGFRAGDPTDTNYLDYFSGGVLSAFRASGVRPLEFGTNGIDTFFISGTGNVGVGAATPGTKLQLSSGTFTIDGNVSPAITIIGSGAPPDSKALCLLNGSLGHCTTIVGATGGCTCSVP